MPSLIHRAISEQDCTELVALHARAFSTWAIATSIFASPRVAIYLRRVASIPHSQREQFLWGAWRGEQLVGYAFGRALPKTWHLNYLAVDTNQREQGIGTSLWDAWLKEGQRRGLREYSLDMWQSNEIARPWYENKGCRVASQTWVQRRPLQRSESMEDGDFQLLNWENAAAWQDAYGFSKFEIARGETRWPIARLGEELFRVTEVLPVEVENFLHQLDPKRSLLVALPHSHSKDEKVALRLEKST